MGPPLECHLNASGSPPDPWDIRMLPWQHSRAAGGMGEGSIVRAPWRKSGSTPGRPKSSLRVGPDQENITRTGSGPGRRGQDSRQDSQVVGRFLESRPAPPALTNARRALPDPRPARPRRPVYDGMIQSIVWSFASGYVILAPPVRAMPGIAEGPNTEGPNTVGKRSHGSCSSCPSPEFSRTCSRDASSRRTTSADSPGPLPRLG